MVPAAEMQNALCGRWLCMPRSTANRVSPNVVDRRFWGDVVFVDVARTGAGLSVRVKLCRQVGTREGGETDALVPPVVHSR